jgi:hypothetical protein
MGAHIQILVFDHHICDYVSGIQRLMVAHMIQEDQQHCIELLPLRCSLETNKLVGGR